MKQLLLSILLLLGWQLSYAQNNLRVKLDSVFAHVDKTQISTGFLEEYGIPFVPLDVFNGVLTDSNKVDIDHWRQVYSTLYTSHINGTNPLPSLATVNSSIDSANSNTTVIAVPLLYARYNYLRSDALSSNLLSVQNNQLFDVANRTQSPYTSRTLFAAAPSRTNIREGNVSLIFKSNLFYNTTTKSINTIQVDFNDGRGYLAVSWNTPVTSSYTTAGEKQIKIKVVFSDYSVVESYAVLNILTSAVAYRYPSQEDKREPFQSTAQHSGGQAFIKYSRSNVDKKIKKPLIVVEGVDYNSIAPLIQDENYTFKDFIIAIDEPSFDFNYYLDNIAGYDLIFLDYTHGSDDIRRNAALLEQVINWVNGEKALAGSTEKNVVLGISMGGLVARYCLADMTKRGIQTDTRLLITHDSPHRGANTPLGVQALTLAMSEIDVIDLLNISPALEQAKDVQNAVASQQMLIVRATNGTGGIAYNSFINDVYQPMVKNFPDVTKQPTYKVIATSLGSQCGIGSLNAGSELVRIEGNHFISLLPWLKRRSFNTSIIAKALPANGVSTQISKVRIWVNYKILSFISISIDLTNKTAASPTGILPWDGAPGGTQSIKRKVGGEIPEYSIKFLPFVDLSLDKSLAEFFCFVPTVSALDISNIDQSSLFGRYFGGATPPSTTTGVNNFIAQEKISIPNYVGDYYNMIHPKFTSRNAEWIFREMENPSGNNLNCTTECEFTSSPISGASVVCGTPEQYSLTNLPNNATVTWSSSNPNGLLIDPNSGIATRINNFNGQITITANVSIGACGSKPVVKSVIVGSPAPVISYTETIIPNKPVKYDFTATSYPGATYQWYVNGVLQSSYTGNTFNTQVLCGMTKVIKSKQTNACGTSSFSNEIVLEGECMTMASTYPNPASSVLTVSFYNDSTLDQSTEYKQVELYNSYQKKVYNIRTTATSIIVPVQNLPNGIYYLKAIRKEGTETKKILISH
jgi:hypothetical protein